MPSGIWIFGNAVQDVTVEVDVDRLVREDQQSEQRLRFAAHPQMRRQTRLEVTVGVNRFAAELELLDLQPTSDDFYTLEPGAKYTLAGRVEEYTASATASAHLLLHGESVQWGGGVLNVARFLRQLAPRPQEVPIRYTDVALGPLLTDVIDHIVQLTQPLIAAEICTWLTTQPARAEAALGAVAAQLALVRPEACLDVYLASLPVQALLYRSGSALSRRNLVFTRFSRGSQATHDKIICRSSFLRLQGEDDERAIGRLLDDGGAAEMGAIVLNSLKDAALFCAAYRFYLKAWSTNPNMVGILAMTTPMQAFTEWLKEQHDQGPFPPFILIFNQEEALAFVTRLQPTLADSLPSLRRGASGALDLTTLGKIAQALRAHFPQDPMPRIYITLGSQGSLGVDSTGEVVYVSCFTRPHETVFDTNACGDAYCAAITLLEWAKRHGRLHLAPVDLDNDAAARAKEMEYFMAVATAAAYAKATHHSGRVDGARVIDILSHTHLASDRLVPIHDLAKGIAPRWVTEGLGQPPRATMFAVTPALAQLLA